MSGSEDLYEFVHAAIERHRVDDGSFDGEVPVTSATALLASTNPGNPHASPERMLLQLREWYGPRFERMSVLALMTHYKIPGSRDIRRVARALWQVHQEPCPDPPQCSLHSLGALWAYRWLDPPKDEAAWLVEALCTLVADHPLRSWALHLVGRTADWVEHAWIDTADAERLLLSAVDAGFHEFLANTESLASSWSILADAASPELRPRLARIGNRIIAAGGTCLIKPQLQLLRERPEAPGP